MNSSLFDAPSSMTLVDDERWPFRLKPLAPRIVTAGSDTIVSLTLPASCDEVVGVASDGGQLADHPLVDARRHLLAHGVDLDDLFGRDRDLLRLPGDVELGVHVDGGADGHRGPHLPCGRSPRSRRLTSYGPRLQRGERVAALGIRDGTSQGLLADGPQRDSHAGENSATRIDDGSRDAAGLGLGETVVGESRHEDHDGGQERVPKRPAPGTSPPKVIFRHGTPPERGVVLLGSRTAALLGTPRAPVRRL